MKNNGVFVVLDWFHYNDSEDSFPVAVTTSFETAKEKVRQRAEEAKQEFIAENYSEKRLNIEEIDDDNFAPDYALGVFHELDGLLEQIAVFQMPVDLGVKTVDFASINDQYSKERKNFKMKNTETVYVVLDCFDYDETDDAFPVAVTGSLESAKKQAQQRAKEAKQEIIDEFNDDRYSDDNLSIKEVDEDGPFYPKFALGVYNDEGLMEKVEVFEQPLNK